MLRRVLGALRRRLKLVLVLTVLLICAMLAPTGWAYAHTTSYRKSPQDVPATPVALVLGAGIRPDGTPSLSLQGRLDVAADLYRRGKVKVLLVSGDNRSKDYDEPTLMHDQLILRGVPAGRIVRDYAGRDTWDSCTRAKRIFGVNQLTVVTQNFHLPRAVALCRRAGLQAWGVAHTVWYRGSTEIGYMREPMAMLKAMTDILLCPDPAVLGRREPGVQQALAG